MSIGVAVRRRPWLPAAIVGGLLLGVLDLAWIKLLPSPWGDLGNSPAVWAVAAFLLGRWTRAGAPRAAVAGAVMLLLATEAYYFAAHLWQHDDLSRLWAPSTMVWLAFGLLAGSLFGAAGAVSRRPPGTGGRRGVVADLALSLPGAVLLAEAGRNLARVPTIDGSPGFRTELVRFAVVLTALAVAVTVGYARAATSRRWLVAGTVVLAGLGFAAMAAAGLGA